MDGTIEYSKTRYLTQDELQIFSYIMLLSPHNWNPNAIRFQQISKILNDVLGSMKFVSAIDAIGIHQQEEEYS